VTTTPMTELVGCTVPIQLAGMGPVCSDELCAAVSEGGRPGHDHRCRHTPATLEARLDQAWPARARSRTTCSMPRAASSWLTARLAWPAPITATRAARA